MNFHLHPLSTSETSIVILVTDVTFSQKLRGTLTYMVQEEERTVQNKLDFILNLPCSSFIIAKISHDDILTELLRSGQLLYKHRIELSKHKDFMKMIKKVCLACHLVLVEHIGDTASLYGQSLKSHHLCLLLKQNVSELCKRMYNNYDFFNVIKLNYFSHLQIYWL